MAVFVDRIVKYPQRAAAGATRHFGNGMPSCHMTADTSAELQRMARRLQLKPAWIQCPGTRQEHYDLTPAKRLRAVELGATDLHPPAPGTIVRCLSLDEPWASFMAYRLKQIETRGWATQFVKQPLGIASTAVWSGYYRQEARRDEALRWGIEQIGMTLHGDQPPTMSGLSTNFVNGYSHIEQTLGHIVCVVYLDRCTPVEQLLVTARENAYGNYEHGEGRYGWITEGGVRLAEPVKTPRGMHQKLWVYCDPDRPLPLPPSGANFGTWSVA